jgi:hypothetical protein
MTSSRLISLGVFAVRESATGCSNKSRRGMSPYCHGRLKEETPAMRPSLDEVSG